MLSIAHSKLALPTQFLFLLSNAVGLLVGIIYNSQTPDLYENNAHHKIGWIATWVVSAQVIMSLIFAYTGRGDSEEAAYKRATFMPVSTDETDSPTAYPPGSSHEYRWSRDSGQGTERNTSSLHSRPSSPYASPTDEYDEFDKPEDHIHEKPERRAWLHNTGMGRFLTSRLPQMVSSRVLRVMNVIYKVIDRIIMPFGFAAIATGGVTYGGLMVSLQFFHPSFPYVKLTNPTERQGDLQRTRTLYQRRHLLLVRGADPGPNDGLLGRPRLGLEPEAVEFHRGEMEGARPIRGIHRMLRDFPLRMHQRLPGAPV